MNESKLNSTRHAFGTSTSYIFDEPNYCVHCRHTMTPINRTRTEITYTGYVIIGYQCSNTRCKESLVGIYKKQQEIQTNLDLLYIYPSVSIDELPERVAEKFPRFKRSFEQANNAEQLNHLELAGSGYRNAIEILIKDYAIQELDENSDQVSKKKIYKVIEDYFPDADFQVSADMVRILGNDNTHYERRYEDIDFNVLKSYLNIFIQLVETKLMIKYPPIEKALRDQ